MLSYNSFLSKNLISKTRKKIASNNILGIIKGKCLFGSQINKKEKFKVVADPKEANKLIFHENGKCKIFEHKDGEA